MAVGYSYYDVCKYFSLPTQLKDELLAADVTDEISQPLGEALASTGITYDDLMYQIQTLSVESSIQTVGIVNFGIWIFIKLNAFEKSTSYQESARVNTNRNYRKLTNPILFKTAHSTTRVRGFTYLI